MPVADPSLLATGLAVGLLAGLCGGFLAGLCGLGGGLIYVPAFLAALPQHEPDPALPIFASLVAVGITSMVSTRTHWKLGHVDIPVLRRLVPALSLGAMLGLWFALHAPEIAILLLLSAINAWVAWDYGNEPFVRSQAVRGWIGLPIGYLSAAAGIGGGTMLVPLLRRWLDLRHAVGTTSACTLFMILVAIAGNTVLEPEWRHLFAQHAPFLLAAWAGVAIATPGATRWGAGLHRHYSEHALRIALKAFFAGLSLLWLISALRMLSA